MPSRGGDLPRLNAGIQRVLGISAFIGILLAHSCGSGEMADTQVLGTCVFGRVGSSPTSRTK